MMSTEEKTKRTQALFLLNKAGYKPSDFLDWTEEKGVFDEASDVEKEAQYIMKFLEEKKFLKVKDDGSYVVIQ